MLLSSVCSWLLLALLLQPEACLASEPLSVKVVWWDSPPYIYRNSSGQISGIVKQTFEEMTLRKCQLSNISYSDTEYKTYKDFLSFINTLNSTVNGSSVSDSTLTIYFPVFQDSEIKHRYFFREIGFATSPGVTLVTDYLMMSRLYRLMVLGLSNCKLFLIIIMIALLNIGVLIWICVSIYF